MTTLLIIIPALNESATIQQIINKVPEEIEGVSKIDVLVIDDGSNDDTGQLAREAGAQVISHPSNLGVGAAVQTGLNYAVENHYNLAVNIDADGQFDPRDISKLVDPIIKEKADFVSASRFIDPNFVPAMSTVKHWGNFCMSAIISRLAGKKFYDVSCGFRAYSREALLRLILRGEFTYTQEMFLIFSYKRLRIMEIPVRARGIREFGDSRVASNLINYAFRTAVIIYRCFRDYRPGILFNGIAAALLIVAFPLGAFFLGHRIMMGRFSPHIWSGFLSGFLFTISFVVFLFGQIASMLDRERFYLEEIIYNLRKHLIHKQP